MAKDNPRRLILTMLAAFTAMGDDGLARIHARQCETSFTRRAARLGIVTDRMGGATNRANRRAFPIR